MLQHNIFQLLTYSPEVKILSPLLWKRPSDESPGAVFMPFGRTFGHNQILGNQWKTSDSYKPSG
jgi:hypothetical protein